MWPVICGERPVCDYLGSRPESRHDPGSVKQDVQCERLGNPRGDRLRALTPDYVNSATGLELHQYKWLENEELIGKIDEEWNWLVGEYEYNPNAKLVHYTEGGPYFKKYKNCDYAEEWFDTFKETTRTDM